MSKDVAQNYVSAASAQDGRDPNIPIVVVQAGREPPMFTCHFLGWDADAAQRFEDPYERRKRLLEEEKQRKREEEEAKVRLSPHIEAGAMRGRAHTRLLPPGAAAGARGDVRRHRRQDQPGPRRRGCCGPQRHGLAGGLLHV